jgi:predicted glycosyltransferase
MRWIGPLETDPVTLIATHEGVDDCTPQAVGRLAANVRCPVLVIHGSDDAVRTHGQGAALAERTGGTLVALEGSGHFPHTRDPVRVNLLIRQFVEGVRRQQVWTRGLTRPRRALYLSSPIGLGHARRDVAVATELKRLRPDLEIDWLAQHPVTSVLEAEGERIHPASAWLANESAHIASEACEHDLHCFQALRRMDEILVANFMVFQEVVEEGLYDLVIGDEAWDVDHFWHENPELKRGDHVWLTDFVGYLPMPDGGEHEAFLTTDYNAEMIEHIARYPRIRDSAIFVGSPDDIVPDTFGAGLPSIRDWTEAHFSFAGYITGFNPPDPDEVSVIRAELGYRDDERVCVVAVGGSGVGRALLEKVIAAYPMAKRLLPELRMVAVAGPRIDPGSLPSHPGLEVHGYVDRLYRHLSVCDLAVVQGGLTTTMELTAAKRPFLYFPLRHHFEQNFHVRHRLDRYGAGHRMDYATSDPDLIAAAIAAHIGDVVTYRDVETDGAAQAARLIAELV